MNSTENLGKNLLEWTVRQLLIMTEPSLRLVQSLRLKQDQPVGEDLRRQKHSQDMVFQSKFQLTELCKGLSTTREQTLQNQFSQ